MAEVSAYEAKTHLSQLLERARQGERIVITRHGAPVAELGPCNAVQQADADALYDAFALLRARTTLGPDLTVKELVEEGRR
jgi:prevent-host-death family protein